MDSGQDGGVFDDLLLIGLKFRPECFAQRHRLGGDDVLQGAALGAGEDGGVQLFGDLRIVAQQHAAPGSAEGLVGGGGDHVGVGDRGWMEPGGHQAGDVSHVHEQVGPHLVGDLREALEVNDTGVGGGTGDDHFGAVTSGQISNLVIVDAVGYGVYAVGHHFVLLPGEVDGGAVGQVAAIVQAHAQDGVAILAEGLVDSVVCLCAGMGLYIGKAGAEELPGPLDGDVLHYIYALAAAVIPFSGVALRVFVGEHRTGSGQHGGADHVLRGDEFDVLLLAVIFRLNCPADLGVGGGDEIHGFLDQWEHSFVS